MINPLYPQGKEILAPFDHLAGWVVHSVWTQLGRHRSLAPSAKRKTILHTSIYYKVYVHI
jgi:hypothetical protein